MTRQKFHDSSFVDDKSIYMNLPHTYLPFLLSFTGICEFNHVLYSTYSIQFVNLLVHFQMCVRATKIWMYRFVMLED